MMRGTISEMDPAGSVTITTTAGKVREFPMTEVAYAGPAKDEPQHKPDVEETPSPPPVVKPYVTVNGERALVKLKSTQGQLTFYRQTDAAEAVGANGVAVAIGFSRLCVAPCEIEIPAGTEMLSVSPGGRHPARPVSVTIPPGRSDIIGSYESNKGTRAAGVVLFVATGITSAVLMGMGISAASTDGEVDTGMLVAGGLVLVGGTLGGVYLVTQRDKATFKVHPQRDTAARLNLQRDSLPKSMMLRWSTAL